MLFVADGGDERTAFTAADVCLWHKLRVSREWWLAEWVKPCRTLPMEPGHEAQHPT